MDRRTFNTSLLTVAGVLCVSDTFAAGPKQRIGFLGTAAPDIKVWKASMQMTSLAGGLWTGGEFIEGSNLDIEYRLANDDAALLRRMADDLVALKVSVIVAAGSSSAVAARDATQTIPIAFTTVTDPIKLGLVKSLGQPGTNATGTAGLTSELDSHRLEILSRIGAKHIGVLINANREGVHEQTKVLLQAANYLGLTLRIEPVAKPDQFAAAVIELGNVDAILVTADPMFNNARAKLVPIIESRRVPAIYQWKGFTEIGGLMSYGPDINEAYQTAGVVAGRILKGAQPQNIPVVRPTHFSLDINRERANALGLNLKPELLLRGSGGMVIQEPR